MSTERIAQNYDTGADLYYRVLRLSDGLFFDFDDESWQTLAAAVTPEVAMPAVAVIGGGDSLYAADLDLALLNDTTTPLAVRVLVYLQAGGSPDPDTDEWQREAGFTVTSGSVDDSNGLDQDYYVDVTANYTTTLGTAMHFTAELKTRGGKSVELATLDPTATCSIEVTMDADTSGGDRFPVFTLDTTDCGSVNTDSQFEVEYADPGLTSNKGFKAKAFVTTGGRVFEGDAKFNT